MQTRRYGNIGLSKSRIKSRIKLRIKSRIKFVTGRLVLLLTIVGILATWPAASGAEHSPEARTEYRRSEPEVVENTLRDILEDPRYTPRRNFWQWLVSKLEAWDTPDLSVPEGIAEVFVWALLIWCSLTLLAITAHLLYVLVGGLRNLFGSGASAAGGAEPGSAQQLSYAELMERRERCAREGNFRRATALLMAALLRLLDSAGAIRFHPGKTNGEYTREYSRSLPGRAAFADFVRRFDALVYGSAGCEESDYIRMSTAFEEVRDRVREQS